MQLLTTTGYKNIEDCQIGEQLVAYEVESGDVITNELLGKEWFSPSMFSDQYSIPVEVLDEYDNIVFEQIPVLDENGDFVYEQISIIDEDGNETFIDGEQIFEDGEPLMTESVLLKTKEEAFTETYGDLTFRKINNNWDLFNNQSIWANLTVVHASDLQVGDIIYNDQNEDVEITSIEDDIAEGWWRLTVSGDHSYISDDLTLHNASRYWVGGGSSANWNATGNTNWGSASGGANNSSVPSSVDDVIFDGAGTNGNTGSTISVAITILSINITSAYTATMTHNAILSIAGNVTLGANYTIAGTQAIVITGNSTITSNGKTFPNAIQFTVFGTKTLVGDLNINGQLLINNGTTINKTTTEKIVIFGGLNNSAGLSGTADVYLTGGTWTMNGGLNNNLYINGNITITGNGSFGGAIFTYLSGTVVTTGSTINFGQNTTITSGTIVFNNIQFSAGGATKTLVGDMTMTGVLSTSNTTIINKTATEQLNVGGGLTMNGPLSGTAKINLTGGVWSSVGIITSDLNLNGNITISGIVNYNGVNFTYISGTITTTGSTVVFTGTTTITSGTITYNNVTFNSVSTRTLVGNMTVNGLLYIQQNAILNRTTTERITAAGGINGFQALSGTADVYFTGGTWYSNNDQISNNFYINGNVTISGPVRYSGANFTYLSGTVTTTGSTVSFSGIPNCTITSGPIIFNNVTVANTKILVGDLIINGLLTVSISTINKTTSENIICNGGISLFQSGSLLTGTANVYLKGGTWSAVSNSDWISSNLFIDGNATISGTVKFQGPNFTYLSGTVTTTGSNVQFNSNVTITSAGNAFNNVTFANTGTKTLVGNMTVNGALSVIGITTLNRTTTETISLFGGFSTSGANNITLSGTAKVIAKGGTFTSASGNPGANMKNNLDVDGNVTFSPTNNFWYSTGTFTYISGTTSGIIGFTGGCTVSSLGMTITSVRLSQAVNIVNDLIMTGPLLNQSINSSINYVSTVANVYANGLDMSGGALDGNVSLYLGGGTYSGLGLMNLLNLYLNGNITISGSVRNSCTNFTYLSGNIDTSGSSINFNNNTIITSGPIIYNNVSFGGNNTQQFVGDFNINGTLTTSANLTFNKTTTEKMTVAGGIIVAGGLIAGNADLYITGGTITTPAGPFDNIPVYLKGDIILSGTVRKRGGSLTYISGKINSSNAILTIESPTLMIGFNKCPLKAILITAGQTLTVDQMPCGTPSQACTIYSTSTTSNYAINFQDGFEKIGRFVALTNANISRPNQLLIINRPRFNTNRNTNSQNIRYYNQSPNGVPKGKQSIVDTMTSTALGLVNDPNFIRQ